ncbi:protein max-like [Vulpes vulpes]|uniref:Protein max-like n=1 Tax=Vulpes vulpes TaxID=9627 RepID=A0ABM4YLZ4_VULVU
MNDNNDIEVESYEVQPRFPSAQAQAHILDRSTDYIQCLQRKKHTHQQDIDDLKGKNALLEQRVHSLEKARSSVQLPNNYPSLDNSVYTNAKGSTISAFDGGSDSSLE